eukprot:scaffold1130_cov195-Pinguiococcus_pyrenoidosus.AAC.78
MGAQARHSSLGCLRPGSPGRLTDPIGFVDLSGRTEEDEDAVHDEMVQSASSSRPCHVVCCFCQGGKKGALDMSFFRVKTELPNRKPTVSANEVMGFDVRHSDCPMRYFGASPSLSISHFNLRNKKELILTNDSPTAAQTDHPSYVHLIAPRSASQIAVSSSRSFAGLNITANEALRTPQKCAICGLKRFSRALCAVSGGASEASGARRPWPVRVRRPRAHLDTTSISSAARDLKWRTATASFGPSDTAHTEW